ncbi:MAG: Trk system potassium transporter TrkA [Lachnospiraceae bacterium]|nr:Trk system potassium transporter TrkA [Lachnospiraceae bacterium]
MENPFRKTRGLKIIIVGCGKVGKTLVERLSQEKHDITVIDTDSDEVDRVSETYDVMGIIGNGSSYNVLLDAGINDADILIAVTASDELNMLCCTIANQLGNCATIARVRNPDYSSELTYLRARLGISLILNPELETAREIARLLRLPTAQEINAFTKGHAELIKFKLPDGNVLDGARIMEIRHYNSELLVCGVERNGEVVIPDGNFELKGQDYITFISTPVNTQSFFKKINIDTHQVRNCIIVGGGKSSYYLAKQLTEMNIDVKIIEIDMKRCEELSALIPQALVICGDGTDEQVLRESGIEEAEAVVPLTGLDEENILITLFAKSCTSAKVITKIKRSSFHEVIDSLDMGSIIYPRYMTAETIIGHVRATQNGIGSNIEVLYHIFDNKAEAIEFNTERNSPVVGKPIMELKLKDNLLIACINRNGKIIIPKGDDYIQEDDKVVIVTTHTGFRDLKDILK